MAYADYLRSAHWQEQRRRYRASKLPQNCHVCGHAKTQLHHKSYRRIGSERLTDLLPLCDGCHKAVHDGIKRWGGTWTLWNAARKLRRQPRSRRALGLPT